MAKVKANAQAQAKNDTAKAQAQVNADVSSLEKTPKDFKAFKSWLEKKLKRISSVSPSPKNPDIFNIMLFRLNGNFKKFDVPISATFTSSDGDDLVFTSLSSGTFREHKDKNGVYLMLTCNTAAVNVKFKSVEIN